MTGRTTGDTIDLMSSPEWLREGRTPRFGPPSGAPAPRLGPPRALFVWVPVFLSFVVQVPAAVFAATHHPEYGAAGALIVLFALIGPVALIFARRFPGPVVAITVAAACADLVFTPGSGAPYIAVAFAIVSAMVRGARIWALVSVSTGWVLALIGSVLMGVAWHPARVILTTVGVVIVLIIGESIRTRHDRVAAFQDEYRRRRDDVAQAERERIARELHDVLAHSLSQINVQAGVGLHLIDDHPEKAAEALASIKSTSKTALDEVRGVLGFLRSASPSRPESSNAPEAPIRPDALIRSATSPDSRATSLNSSATSPHNPARNPHNPRNPERPVDPADRILRRYEQETDPAPLTPQADLTRLPSLIESISSDDLEVTLVNRLTSDPPPGVQLALYRITQESLTNVTRHAHATRVRVTLDERADDYQLSVIDDGSADSSRPDSSAAHPRAADGSSPDARAAVFENDMISPGVPVARASTSPRPAALARVFDSGNGLLGMTERAELLGGHLEAGPVASGGFAVVATVPRRPRKFGRTGRYGSE